MKIALSLLLAIHALIHLMGFWKAFGLGDIPALTQSISRPIGLLWLLACLLFGLAGILYLKNFAYWWAVGIAAIAISQFLIFMTWQDAKVGTVANVILLLACILAAAQLSFAQKIAQERNALLAKAHTNEQHKPSSTIQDLPAPVQRWFTYLGYTEPKQIEQVYLKQKARMKMKPEQQKWYEATAEQHFTLHPPAFIWSVDMDMPPLLSIQGRDKFADGQGEMLMKLCGLIPIVDVSQNPKVDEAALQRYLAEMVWFPSAVLSTYVQWEYIDENKAKAVMTYQGTTGSGIFHFAPNGAFTRFEAMRYQGSDAAAQRVKWIVEVQENDTFNGIEVPAKLQASWMLEDGKWTWLELEITELVYTPAADMQSSTFVE